MVKRGIKQLKAIAENPCVTHPRLERLGGHITPEAKERAKLFLDKYSGTLEEAQALLPINSFDCGIDLNLILDASCLARSEGKSVLTDDHIRRAIPLVERVIQAFRDLKRSRDFDEYLVKLEANKRLLSPEAQADFETVSEIISDISNQETRQQNMLDHHRKRLGLPPSVKVCDHYGWFVGFSYVGGRKRKHRRTS